MASGDIQEEVILEGPGAQIVHLVGCTGRSQIHDFLEKLEARRLKEYERVIAILELVAEEGPQNVGSGRAKSLRAGIYEFKSGQIRLFWIYGTKDRLRYLQRKVVLLRGKIKKRNRLDARTLRLIKALKQQYEKGQEK